MIEIKCYVCTSIFCIDPKACIATEIVLERKKHHITESYVKKTIKRGLHCPYCGAILLDKILEKEKQNGYL